MPLKKKPNPEKTVNLLNDEPSKKPLAKLPARFMVCTSTNKSIEYALIYLCSR
jgi:hypothetical protein